MTAVPDVSIVLNVHREGVLLPRTLRAIEDTAIHAGFRGITCELVVVLDNADALTRDAVDTIDPAAFSRVVTRAVANGSLGPSRNDGVALAEGAFVMTVDGDDIYSFNYLAQLYAAASRASAPTIVYPQYSICFGQENYLHRILPLAESGRHRLAGTHTFASCLMAPTVLLRELRYRDCSKSAVYAYEDYDLNLRAVAAGVDIQVGEDAVLFYRKHARSIMAGLHDATRFIAPPSDFFRPDLFCAGDHHVGTGGDPAKADRWMKAFRASSRLAELIAHANTIEPEIDMPTIAQAVVGTAAGFETAFGAAYHDLCLALDGWRFTDVALVSSLAAVPPLVLEAMRTTTAQCPDRRFLVIGGEAAAREAPDLPPGSLALDLAQKGAGLSPFRIIELALRLVQSVAPRADLHLAGCPFVDRFLRQFAEALRPHRVAFYDVGGDDLMGAAARSAVLSACHDNIDLVLSDRTARIDGLVARMPSYAGRALAVTAPPQRLDAALGRRGPKPTEDRWTAN